MKFKYIVAGTTLSNEIKLRYAKDLVQLRIWIMVIEDFIDDKTADEILQELKNKKIVKFHSKDQKYSWTIQDVEHIKPLTNF